MARRMPELGRVFVQAESELGAINMALGAAATGARVMVSSSSPGISLMAEAMSYMAGSGTPMVLVNVMRAGPGLGGIGPSQSDYFQATKGHGHGDYRRTGPGSRFDRRGDGADGDCLRAGRTVSDAGHAPRRRHPRPGNGAGRAPVPNARAPGLRLGAHGSGRPAGSDRQVDRPRSGGPGASKPGSAAQVPRDRPPRDPLGEPGSMDDAEFAIVAYGTAARVARSAIAKARARTASRSASSARSRCGRSPSASWPD